MKYSMLALLIAVAVTGCSEPAPHQTSTEAKASAEVKATPSAAELYDVATQTLFQARALNAAGLGLSAQQTGKDLSAQMEDYGSENEQGLRQRLSQLAQQLAALPAATSPQDEENQKVMLNILQYYAGEPGFAAGYIDPWMGHSAFVVNQINGPVIDMAGALQNSHPIQSEQDAKNYLSRLEKFGPALASVQQKFELDAQSGWMAPKISLERALVIINSYANGDASDNVLYQDFARKLAALTDLPQAKHDDYLAEAKALVAAQVQAGYQKLAAAVQAKLPIARTESGIWAQPGGADYYAWSVKQLGDTNLSPEQIHQLGLAEVARITSEMEQILQAEGYKQGSVGERMAQLNNEPRFLYQDSDAGRQQLLDDLNRYIHDIAAKMPDWYATKPPYEVEVRRIPVDIQDSAPGGQYTSPAIDGSKPGIYWINLRDIKANAKFDLKSLTYHEAIPGHHWQVALNLAQDHLPLLRRVAPYNSYVEGWALYSEQVAKEMGMYQDDPFGDLGRLKAELFRSVRLVVDTGMHAKKWTREQAIDYMAKTTGTTESDVIAEIERYMAWPGQALGYKLGMLKILELRQYARTELGDKFDIRAFHDLVLLGGAVPMTVLEQKVKNWVAAQKA